MTEIEKRLIAEGKEQEFILAGNSRVTFKSVATGNHFTFKIRKADKRGSSAPEAWFVSVMYDYEEEGYTYLGMINSHYNFFATKASRGMEDAPSFLCFKWTWNNLMSDKVEIWHEGRCGRCGRALTDPTSIDAGYGPHCRGEI